jgi:hypothetical protein
MHTPQIIETFESFRVVVDLPCRVFRGAANFCSGWLKPAG